MSSTTSIVTDGTEPMPSQMGKQPCGGIDHTYSSPHISAMAGPPTPPPTSAVELQDQARSIASEKSTAEIPSETGTRPEIYQSVQPAIVDRILRNDYVGLVKVTERVDLTVSI
jgi:hypothetical protein